MITSYVRATTVAIALFICLLASSPGLGEDLPPASGSVEKTFGSVEERRLQAEIDAQRQAIIDEKKALELRENELKTLEATVDKKLAELDEKLARIAAQQKALEAVLAKKSAEELKKIQDLSKIYEKMDPGKAAIALSGLEERLAADILANMKVKAAARILDSLNKQKAIDLSKSFSTIQTE